MPASAALNVRLTSRRSAKWLGGASRHALRLSAASSGLKKSSRPPSLNDSLMLALETSGVLIVKSTRTLAGSEETNGVSQALTSILRRGKRERLPTGAREEARLLRDARDPLERKEERRGAVQVEQAVGRHGAAAVLVPSLLAVVVQADVLLAVDLHLTRVQRRPPRRRQWQCCIADSKQSEFTLTTGLCSFAACGRSGLRSTAGSEQRTLKQVEGDAEPWAKRRAAADATARRAGAVVRRRRHARRLGLLASSPIVHP